MRRYFPEGFVETEYQKTSSTDIKLILRHQIEVQERKMYIFIGWAPYKNEFVISDNQTYLTGRMPTFPFILNEYSESTMIYLPLMVQSGFRFHTVSPTPEPDKRLIMTIQRRGNTIFYDVGKASQFCPRPEKIFLNWLDIKYLEKYKKEKFNLVEI